MIVLPLTLHIILIHHYHSQMGIYSTRIRGDTRQQITCVIRRRNHQILPIQHYVEDGRLLFLYSPGFELADPEP